MIQLREYQEKLINDIRGALKYHSNILVQSPTGSGKTKTFVTIANNSCARGHSVFVISESLEIYRQIVDEIGTGVISISDGIKDVHISDGNMYVAMAQTLVRRPNIVKKINSLKKKPVIIIDEAHVGTSTKLVDQLTGFRMGFTATPDFKIAKHLPTLYDCLVEGPSVQYLIQKGNLCNCRHIKRQGADLSKLELNSTGEFSEASNKKAFGGRKLFEGLVEDLKREKWTKCMVFVSSIDECEEVNSQLIREGFSSISYHSKTNNPKFVIKSFTEYGMADICVSVGALTKGFDCPEVDIIALRRKTTSLALYLQMIGRGSRPHSNKNGWFTVLDYGENIDQHGPYTMSREWSEMWQGVSKSKKGSGVAPIKECPLCSCFMHVTRMVCEYCNFAFPASDKIFEGETIVVDTTENFTGLIGRPASTLSPEELTFYAKHYGAKNSFRIARWLDSRNYGYLDIFAKKMGYRRGWAKFQRSLPYFFNDFVIK